MTTINECFQIIIVGNKDDSRKAARQVRKLLYRSSKEDFKGIKKYIDLAPKTYENIKEEWRQENFVVAISVIYFLHSHENKPDFLFGWLFHLLQHPNGNIRQASVRMIKNELGPLTVYLRVPGFKSSYKHITPEFADVMLYNLYANLVELSENLFKPSYNKYKYVHSLPTGPYKSVQMLLAELREDCGEEYMNRLKSSYQQVELINKRKDLIKQINEGGVLIKTAFTLAQTEIKQLQQELEINKLPEILKILPGFNFETVRNQVYLENMGPDETKKLFDLATGEGLTLEQRNISYRYLFS
jgi:hypothetical protein